MEPVLPKVPTSTESTVSVQPASALLNVAVPPQEVPTVGVGGTTIGASKNVRLALPFGVAAGSVTDCGSPPV
jgi:hypothetical protein